MNDKKLERITLKSFYSTLLEQFHLEKGIGFTIKQFMLHPQKAIDEYFYIDRKRMIRPSRFLLLTVAIATFLSYQFFPLGDKMAEEFAQNPDYQKIPEQYLPAISYITALVNKYFNLVFMSSLPFVSVGTLLLFPMKGYNFAEHLILNIYLFCIQTIIFIITIPFLESFVTAAYIQIVVITTYTLYFYNKVFGLSWFQSIWRTTLVWIISQFGVSIIILILVVYMTYMP